MLKNLEEALRKEAKNVVKQSRSNLTRNDKNVSNKLYDGLDYTIDSTYDGAGITFKMPEYGKFQDEGVSGVLRKYQTPYSFKANKFINTSWVKDWAKKRGIRLRDSKGRFKKGGVKTLSYLIGRKVWQNGIKPSLFFTKPYERLVVKLDDVILDALIKDIEDKNLNE
jgi:hypothetical protein